MAPWAEGVRERGRTYEGCRDLHQTRLVLAAAWLGGGALRERERPSFELMPEGLRISFETNEDGEELLESCALHAHIASQHIFVHCNMEPSAMESRAALTSG